MSMALEDPKVGPIHRGFKSTTHRDDFFIMNILTFNETLCETHNMGQKLRT